MRPSKLGVLGIFLLCTSYMGFSQLQATAPSGGGGGTGTVTSVALAGSGNLFSATPGTAVTTSGTLNIDAQLFAQSANCVVAGPSTGAAASPTCRALVAADLPNGGAVPNALTLNNSNAGATSGTTFNGSAAVTLSANTLGAPSLANQNTYTGAAGATTSSAQWTGTLQSGSTTTPPQYYFDSSPGVNEPVFATLGTLVGLHVVSNTGQGLFDAYAGITKEFEVSAGGTGYFNNNLTVNKITTSNAYISVPSTITYAAALTIPITDGLERLTLTTGGVTSSTIAAGTDGQRLCLDVIQSSTAAQTVVWPTNLHGAFTIGVTLGKDNVQCFTYSGTSTAWLAESAGVINQ